MKLDDSVVLITGGTGSFGSRVAAHLLKQRPREIRIYSRDEKKQYEMKKQFPDFRYVLGDVRDLRRLTEAMEGSFTTSFMLRRLSKSHHVRSTLLRQLRRTSSVHKTHAKRRRQTELRRSSP